MQFSKSAILKIFRNFRFENFEIEIFKKIFKIEILKIFEENLIDSLLVAILPFKAKLPKLRLVSL